jgi:hypothetical protein
MPRKRIPTNRRPDEIIRTANEALNAIPFEPATNSAELRQRVTLLVGLWRQIKELGLAHVRAILLQNSAAERILAYLRLFVGNQVEGEELEVISGISEYARRVREWRVEFGWPILHEGSTYRLERDQPDEAKAELWRIVNAIRRSDASARDKMLALFRASPVGTLITTAQLRYVTEGKDMRRVRELRTQFGWRIMTNKTGMPELKNGQYVLVDPEPLEEHDRDVEQDTIIAVLKRDRNKCRKCGWHPHDRIPGDPRQYIELHHVTWHVEGGANEADNLISLCNVHHNQVHARHLGREALFDWLGRD